MTHQRSRDHSESAGIEPLRLSREDRRKMYAMLDADLPPRIGRIELALAVTVPSNLALLWKVFGSPQPTAAAHALISLFS